MVGEEHDDDQGEDGYGPVLPGTVDQRFAQPLLAHDEVVGVAGATCHIMDRRGVQGKADGEDDSTCDDRREQLADLLDEDADDHGDHAADDHRSGNAGNAAATSSDGLHTGQVSKADAKHDRQSRAEFAPDGEQLQQRRYSGHDQGRLNQKNTLRLGQADDIGDDNCRRDAADDHGDQMLQRHGQGNANGRDAVELEKCLGAMGGIFHSGCLRKCGKPEHYLYRKIV